MLNDSRVRMRLTCRRRTVMVLRSSDARAWISQLTCPRMSRCKARASSRLASLAARKMSHVPTEFRAATRNTAHGETTFQHSTRTGTLIPTHACRSVHSELGSREDDCEPSWAPTRPVLSSGCNQHSKPRHLTLQSEKKYARGRHRIAQASSSPR